MIKVTYITPDFAVAPAIGPADFDRLVELGFRTVINNRPDGEERDQAPSSALKAAAEGHGLAYRHIPARKTDIFADPVVDAMAEALQQGPGPIVAHCRSGLRSAMAWAAASARSQPVDEIMGKLQAAGFDLKSIRDDLESLAHRARWGDPTHLATEASAA